MKTENTISNIKGNETIKEFVDKVNLVDSLKEKIGVCIMVIYFIEIRNDYRPGSSAYKIGSSKEVPPRDPTDKMWIKMCNQLGMSVYEREINDFLFYLKNSDYDCFSMLVDTNGKISKKEERKETLISYSIIGIILLLIIYFWNNPL